MANILVIDDSEAILAKVAGMLTAAGHNVVSTSSARRGIELLQRAVIDLVVTDIYMPDFDGIELLRAMRGMRSGARTIVMSTNPAPFDIFPVARTLGAARALQKPFSQEDLLACVQSLLHARVREASTFSRS